MKLQGCYYCDRDEAFRELLFEICDLKASKIFLCKDQTLPGRCTIMFKDHYEEIYEIPKADRDAYMDDVCALAETIKELFHPDKINYGIYGDTCRHVHYTICPKYEGKLGWGTPFIMFPDPSERIYLSEGEYAQRMDLICRTVRAKLGLPVDQEGEAV